MCVRMFKLIIICALGLTLLGLAGCQPRPAPSSDPLAGGGAGATQDAGSLASEGEVMPAGGRVSGNELEFGQGRRAAVVYGAYSEGREKATNNHLRISGGEITDSAYGAFTEGQALRNKLTVTGGVIKGRLESGHGRQGSADNEFVFAGGEAGSAYGGYSQDGPADNNVLVITGGVIHDDAHGGLSLRGSATGNTLRVEGGVINDQAYGGYGMEGPAKGNTTIVSGGVINSDAQGGISSTHEATDNTLILRGAPQIGGSVYGGFAVNEHGDNPEDIKGNKILLEGFNGALGDIWCAEKVNIDAGSRLSNREQALNFYDCRNVRNDGIIAASKGAEIYFDAVTYQGQGRFELVPGAYIKMNAGKLQSPLRIKITATGAASPFSAIPIAELNNIKFGPDLDPATAVQLLDNNTGGLTLSLSHEQYGASHSWYLSGE